MISYNRPLLSNTDINEVIKVLKTKSITQGKYVDKFEKALISKFGSKYAVALSSGTAALHLAGIALGWKKKDIILISPITFLATAYSVLYAEAKLDFVDINSKSYNIDLTKLEIKIRQYKKINKKIKAVIATDYAGQPCDWKKLKKLSLKYGFDLLNDNCHAIGSKYYGDICYSSKYADITIHSYHAVKNITTGEGGSILTNKYSLYKKIKMLRSHGIDKSKINISKPWIYKTELLGYNYRLTDFQCALGYSQLRRLKNNILERRLIAKNYNKKFSKNPNLIVPKVENFSYHAYHLYPLQIKFTNLSTNKSHFFSYCKKNNINLQIHYIPLHFQSFLKKRINILKKDLNNSESFYKNVFSIPLYCGLSLLNQEKVIKIINEYTNKFAK